MRRSQIQFWVFIACVGTASGLLDLQQAQAFGRWRNSSGGSSGGGFGSSGGSWGGGSSGYGIGRGRVRGRWGSWGSSGGSSGGWGGSSGGGSSGGYGGSSGGYSGGYAGGYIGGGFVDGGYIGGGSAGGYGGGYGAGYGGAYGGAVVPPPGGPVYDHGAPGGNWAPARPLPYPATPMPIQAAPIQPVPNGAGPVPEGGAIPPVPANINSSSRTVPQPRHIAVQRDGALDRFTPISQAKTSEQSTTAAKQSGIIVYVPTAAKLFVNGHPMKTEGEVRRFASDQLKAGKTYAYELRAEMVRNGKKLVRTERVELKSGRTEEVAFDFSDTVAMAQPVSGTNPDTQLTVVVPTDALVYLDGEDTGSVGNVRKFITSDLADGKSWKGYEVRVEFSRNGKTITKTAKVDLYAGQKQEVDFEADQQLTASN